MGDGLDRIDGGMHSRFKTILEQKTLFGFRL